MNNIPLNYTPEKLLGQYIMKKKCKKAAKKGLKT